MWKGILVLIGVCVTGIVGVIEYILIHSEDFEFGDDMPAPHRGR